ncbi:MAG: hypothetical protein ACOCXJ_03935 [Planctomycetota bacterium]
MQRFIVFLGLLALLSACGASRSQADLPLWVQQPPSAPGREYAVGRGVVRRLAVDQAVAGVLAQVEVSVRSDRHDSSTYRSEESTDTPRSERLRMAIAEEIRTTVDLEDVQGLRIVREHQGPGGEFMVLAELDRREWARGLRHRVQLVDEDLAAAWQAFQAAAPQQESAIGTLLRLRRRVLPLAVERDLLERRHAVVAPGSSLPEPPVDPARIQEQLATMLDSLRIALDLDEDLQALAPELINALAGAGFTVTDDPARAQLIVGLDLGLSQRRIDGLVRLDGMLTGTVIDAASRQLVCGLRSNERASAADAELARQRLLRDLAPQAAAALDAELMAQLRP